ncbi:class I SAM-dependent methyltransferase [Polynucleobacter paneuropaeus]|nr:class I SAM-dependent methyltransferase [Polynucleobacter paneuropaeus]
MQTIQEIKNYWDQRASDDDTAQSTTQDVYLRSIEQHVLLQWIEKIKPSTIADIGCGDGRTTIGLAQSLREITFSGYDYSQAMIHNANKNLAVEDISNITFLRHDVCDEFYGVHELMLSTRCLINLPTWAMQQQAIRNIHNGLSAKGYYLMIENFADGQENFNQLRRKFDLPEIPQRSHNLFFNRNQLSEFLKNLFCVEHEINISSTYYMVSRIIYSRICQDENRTPDYFDKHHKYAASLPFMGEYGPVRLLVLKKI